MTEKEKRFADEYIIDPNGTSAYAAAYKSENRHSAGNGASRLLKKADVREYIDCELEKIRSEKIADAVEVMEFLTAVMRGEERDEVLKRTGEGSQEVISLRVSERDRIKAAELLGKRYGIFRDKVQVDAGRVVFRDDIDE